MIDYQTFINVLPESRLAPWYAEFQSRINQQLRVSRYADLQKWLTALETLPTVSPSFFDCHRKTVTLGQAQDINDEQRQIIIQALQTLHPWRKGPYALFDIFIDAEWRSDWKWDRLKNHIGDLSGQYVLDVGCGNGYHGWRMAGAGAELVVGIDPSPLFVVQFSAIKHYAGQHPVFVLPFTLDTLPQKLPVFDSVFSMGILYHRRSPFDHLFDLRGCLRAGGQLILETLVIEGGLHEILVPATRYAKMPNVWFIPSVAALQQWLQRCGFVDIRCIDVTQTTRDEQRQTPWMGFDSLADFLDPADENLTIEAYPAPTRAIFIATNPQVREVR